MKKKIETVNTGVEAIKTGKNINRSNKVLVKIPVDALNPLDKEVAVQINGYKWIIKRGETLSLPKEVVQLLQEAGYFG